MIIQRRDDPSENKTTLSVSGRITSDNCYELENALKALDYEGLDLTIDFSSLEYLTSAGLRALLVARKNLDEDKIRIVNVNPVVREIFETTGFMDIFKVETTEDTRLIPEDPSFRDMLAFRSKNSPDKEILFFDDVAYTWRDIDRCAQIIASDLEKAGVHKGSHVGVLSKNSINWVLAFYAIQKLGAIIVLLNFALNPEEIAMYSKIGDITHLCLGDSPSVKDFETFTDKVSNGDSKISFVYDIRSAVDFRNRYAELPEVERNHYAFCDPDDPSVMIFTSGTTGLPKGVLSSSHDRITNCRIMAREMHTDEDDKICLFLPLCHIFGFGTGLSFSLLFDLPIYMSSDISDEVLLNIIESKGCTIFNSVPTKILSMVRNPVFNSGMVKTLRSSMIGGAAITESQLLELREKMPGNHFMPIYGMSEISPISIVKYEDTVEHITRTVGKPVNEIKVEIRNPSTGEICPTGTEGEIVVKSKNSLVCYYKLSIDKQAIDKDGWIPTGDLGVLEEDGYLRITGRSKELIIKGGENISPNEISSVITEVDTISDVKVVGVHDDYFGETIAAAIIMKEGSDFDRASLERHILSKLSKFKLPSYYVLFDQFPLLANGKVDMIELKKDLEKRIKS